MIGKTGRKTKHLIKTDESRLPSSNFRLESWKLIWLGQFFWKNNFQQFIKEKWMKKWAKENWLEHLDETLRQHGVNRCDEGTKFLGHPWTSFFLGGGWLVFGWGGWGGFGIRYTFFFFLAKKSGDII